MSFPSFSKIFVSAEKIVQVVNQLEDQLAMLFKAIFNKPSLDCVILTNIILKSGQVNHVPHTLGRNLRGWKVIRKRNVSADVYDTQDSNTNPATYLDLWTTTNITIDIEA